MRPDVMNNSGSDVPNLLDVQDLKTHFTQSKGLFFGSKETVYAVDGVSFSIKPGEVLSLVGESGCGKSTVGRTLTRLNAMTSGSFRFKGEELSSLSGRQFKPFRRKIQMIFQDPYASLNPRLTIGQTLMEPLVIHGLAKDKAKAKQKVADILEAVGMDPSTAERYPHEFSGGQRQRIGIARVMILAPELVIADEPVSALDVSIQAQILNLMKHLQENSGVSMLFISHDLGVVRHISDTIAVMYMGQIVEKAPKSELFANPNHPYTRLLLGSIPKLKPGKDVTRIEIKGEPPSPLAPPSGCRFHKRCAFATDRCAQEVPKPIHLSPLHTSACHFAEEYYGKTNEAPSI